MVNKVRRLKVIKQGG